MKVTLIGLNLYASYTPKTNKRLENGPNFSQQLDGSFGLAVIKTKQNNHDQVVDHECIVIVRECDFTRVRNPGLSDRCTRDHWFCSSQMRMMKTRMK